MEFENKAKCDRLTLGRNWLALNNDGNLFSATPDKINGAIVKLEKYNGTMMVLSFREGSRIKIENNTLHYNQKDIIDCR
jgi:hypothetical protein